MRNEHGRFLVGRNAIDAERERVNGATANTSAPSNTAPSIVWKSQNNNNKKENKSATNRLK